MIWRIYYRSAGNHVHCRVFVGPQEGALGLAGILTLRQVEFTALTCINRVLPVSWRTEMKPDGLPDLDPAGNPRFLQPGEY
jgi:hypothetical protein